MLELYNAATFQDNLGSPRPADDANAQLFREATKWFPSSGDSLAGRELSEATAKRLWTTRRIENTLVPDAAVAALVILEGCYVNTTGWDIDAYFDDVTLTWAYKKA